MTTISLTLSAKQPAPVPATPGTFALPVNRQVHLAWQKPKQSGTSIQIPEDEPRSYMLIQEGGSSEELYIHAHTSHGEAEDDRENCDENGAYRTSEIVTAPVNIANKEGFYEFIEEVVRAYAELRSAYSDRSEVCINVPANMVDHPVFYAVVEELVNAYSTLGFPEKV